MKKLINKQAVIKILIPTNTNEPKEISILASSIRKVSKIENNMCRIDTDACSIDTLSSFDDITNQLSKITIYEDN